MLPCVHGSASSSSAKRTTAAAFAPTQSDIVSNRDEYYTVASGNLCVKIETQYKLSFAELDERNLAIGDNYQDFWATYSIFVWVS